MWIKTGSVKGRNLSYTSLSSGVSLSITVDPRLYSNFNFTSEIGDGLILTIGRGLIIERTITQIKTFEEGDAIMRYIIQANGEKIIETDLKPWETATQVELSSKKKGKRNGTR